VLGSIDQATGKVSYTPSAGYTGADRLTYHASSANGAAPAQSVSLTVLDPPKCKPVRAARVRPSLWP